MPFLDSGGVLARDDDSARALLEAALARVRERGARTLELRQPGPHPALPAAPEQHRVDLVLRLEGDEEAQWKAVGSKVRNQTRKAEREGLELATGDGASLLGGFYDPFRVNMRDLGSPVHARAFFAEAAESFGERLRFVVTTHGGRSVGGLVAIDYAGCVTVPWASTLRSERRRCPNNQIYWEALRWAIARGAREFDFGRSPRESGTFRFKAGWGAEERELAWLQLSPEGEPLPPGGDAGGLLQKVSEVWTRLPQAVTDVLGPRIRRFFSN